MPAWTGGRADGRSDGQYSMATVGSLVHVLVCFCVCACLCSCACLCGCMPGRINGPHSMVMVGSRAAGQALASAAAHQPPAPGSAPWPSWPPALTASRAAPGSFPLALRACAGEAFVIVQDDFLCQFPPYEKARPASANPSLHRICRLSPAGECFARSFVCRHIYCQDI